MMARKFSNADGHHSCNEELLKMALLNLGITDHIYTKIVISDCYYNENQFKSNINHQILQTGMSPNETYISVLISLLRIHSSSLLNDANCHDIYFESFESLSYEQIKDIKSSNAQNHEIIQNAGHQSLDLICGKNIVDQNSSFRSSLDDASIEASFGHDFLYNIYGLLRPIKLASQLNHSQLKMLIKNLKVNKEYNELHEEIKKNVECLLEKQNQISYSQSLKSIEFSNLDSINDSKFNISKDNNHISPNLCNLANAESTNLESELFAQSDKNDSISGSKPFIHPLDDSISIENTKNSFSPIKKHQRKSKLLRGNTNSIISESYLHPQLNSSNSSIINKNNPPNFKDKNEYNHIINSKEFPCKCDGCSNYVIFQENRGYYFCCNSCAITHCKNIFSAWSSSKP